MLEECYDYDVLDEDNRNVDYSYNGTDGYCDSNSTSFK